MWWLHARPLKSKKNKKKKVSEWCLNVKGWEEEIKLIKCEEKQTVFLCGETKELGGFFQRFALLSSPNHFLPPSVSCRLSFKVFPIRASTYSFFFSFCLSSLLISLLAMPAYLVMMPCWFRPGSSNKKLTGEKKTRKIRKVSECNTPNFHSENKLRAWNTQQVIMKALLFANGKVTS